MREEIQESVQKKKTGKGRKVLVSFGILFIAVGVFLGSFACSFQVMIESAKSGRESENSLEAENQKLQSDVQLLKDQVTILEAELERYKTSGSKTKSSSQTSSQASGTSASGTSGPGTSAKSSTGSSQKTTSQTATPAR